MDDPAIIFAGGFAAGMAFTVAALFVAVLWFARPRHYAGDPVDLSPDDIANSAEAPGIVGRVGCADRAGTPSGPSQKTVSGKAAHPSRGGR